MNNKEITDKLNEEKSLNKDLWIKLISSYTQSDREYAADIAKTISLKNFGNNIFIRGIVEFTNYCKNDCFYCGIRKSNDNVSRYRLTEEEIYSCCAEGYEYGFRTFVLQGGEDSYYTCERMCRIISHIRENYKDCAITLSLGEKSADEYKAYFDAGADRYLLRHETANKDHYSKLHPSYQSFENRMRCLYNLKKIGFQTGCGMMVGSPYQTAENLAEDMIFLGEFAPEMIGMGPFLSHKDTPFRNMSSGSYELTLFLISLCRIMLPNALIPATTALGTINPKGREAGVLSGANVIMPNLSPTAVRKKYMLYDNKICTGDESAQCRSCLEGRMNSIGYKLSISRGDYKNYD